MNTIDINCASLEQLESLIGIGHTKALAIIKTRKRLGGFKSIDDLTSVVGIGESIIEQNKSRLINQRMNPQLKNKSRPQSRSGQRHIVSNKPRPSRRLSTSLTDNSPSTSHDFPKHHRTLQTNKRHKLRHVAPFKRRTRSMGVVFPHGVDTPNNSRSEDNVTERRNSSNITDEILISDRPVNPLNNLACEGDISGVNRLNEVSCLVSSCSTSRQSRIPVPLDDATQSLYKRKRKQNDMPHPCKSASPEKRPCRTKDTSLVPRCVRDIKWRKIPSKDNPPDHYNEWLDTFQGWSNAERLMALDNLISMCEPTQVRHMMQVIEPQFQRDFISLLPKELALYVLSFLDPRDLLRAAQACHYWRILTEDTLLWREKCGEENITDALVYGSRTLRRRPSNLCSSPWKALYMRQHHIEHNWRAGELRSPKVLKGHDDHVITCLEFSGQRIVSGSDDNTLKVWSVVNGKCLRTLVGHTGGVWSSQMHGNTIISGSTDRTLKVWNADSGQCVYTLYGHSSTVRCMHLHGDRVISGSRDATLRVWDVLTGQCLHVLMGHVAAVRCVQYDGKRVVSGAYDFTVKVWDPEQETCLHTLQGHTNRVYSLQFDGVHIVSGSLDTSIRVWDVENGNCLHTLIGHQSLTSGMELKDNILVSGNADSTVKVWDIRTGQCLQTLQGPNKHQSAVTCLFQFNKTFVITSSDDGTVKIWDLKTGEFLRNLVSLESGGSGGVVWRVRCSNTKLVCAVGSRNGTEETKLLVLDFDVDDKKIS